MEGKPVIILGGGLWGGLLAHRLEQALPGVEFRLYEPSKSLGPSNSWVFREGDVPEESLEWVKDFISYGWKSQKVAFENFERRFDSGYSLVLPGQFEMKLRKSLRPDRVRLKYRTELKQLLEEGSFIIDTRPMPNTKSKIVRKTLGVIVELHGGHGLTEPMVMDTRVRQKDLFRHMQYFPLDGHTLMVNDVRFSKEAILDLNTAEEELLWEVRKSWNIKDVHHREIQMVHIPGRTQKNWHDGRVLCLSDIVNPVTGDEFPEAVKLIDRMVKTSFRLGELKEVVDRFRGERQMNRGLSRMILKVLYHSPHPGQRLQLLQWLYRMPHSTVRRFLNGNMGVMDVGKAFFGNPPIPLMRALTSV